MNRTKRSPQFLAIVVAIICLFGKPAPSRAQFGGGTQIVFDPQMFARQLQQLQQETATLTNLAQQLQYAIKNTTGGGAGAWAGHPNIPTKHRNRARAGTAGSDVSTAGDGRGEFAERRSGQSGQQSGREQS